MKYIPLALITFAAIGCGHNEFDVSDAQVSRHKGVSKPAAPTGPVKPPMKIKKGDRLPDGTIADHAGTIMSDEGR